MSTLPDLSNPKPPKPRAPYPWRCRHCFQDKVVPIHIDYTCDINFDGRLVSVTTRNLEIPACSNCGEKVFTEIVDDQINAALRNQLQLLSPEQIRDGIYRLTLPQSEVAARLGVSEDLLWKWANGFTIQSRAMDNYLRVFFQFPQVREMLIAPALASGDPAAAMPTAT